MITIKIDKDDESGLFDLYIDQGDQFFAFSFDDETDALNFKRRSIELFSTVADVFVQPDHTYVSAQSRDIEYPNQLPKQQRPFSSLGNRGQ